MTKPGDSPAIKAACITAEMRKDRNPLEKMSADYKKLLENAAKDSQLAWEKEHKLRQEAEGELTIIKTTSVHQSPEMKEAKKEIETLRDNLDKIKKDNNDLYNRIAELIETNEKEVKNLKWIKDHDYIFLIDENKKLHAELKKLKEGNVDKARKAGM